MLFEEGRDSRLDPSLQARQRLWGWAASWHPLLPSLGPAPGRLSLPSAATPILWHHPHPSPSEGPCSAGLWAGGRPWPRVVWAECPGSPVHPPRRRHPHTGLWKREGLRTCPAHPPSSEPPASGLPVTPPKGPRLQVQPSRQGLALGSSEWALGPGLKGLGSSGSCTLSRRGDGAHLTWAAGRPGWGSGPLGVPSAASSGHLQETALGPGLRAGRASEQRGQAGRGGGGGGEEGEGRGGKGREGSLETVVPPATKWDLLESTPHTPDPTSSSQRPPEEGWCREG